MKLNGEEIIDNDGMKYFMTEKGYGWIKRYKIWKYDHEASTDRPAYKVFFETSSNTEIMTMWDNRSTC